MTAEQLGALIARVTAGTITGKVAKSLFDSLWKAADPKRSVDDLIKEQGLEQVSDTGELAAVIRTIVDANPEQVAQFRAGKEKVLGFFVGQIMKATQGRANPQQVNSLLREALSATDVLPIASVANAREIARSIRLMDITKAPDRPLRIRCR